jgi:hypothetical protein
MSGKGPTYSAALHGGSYRRWKLPLFASKAFGLTASEITRIEQAKRRPFLLRSAHGRLGRSLISVDSARFHMASV